MVATDVLPPTTAAALRPARAQCDACADAALIRAMYDAYARRDLLDVFSCFSPDIVIRQSTHVPWGGTYRGLDEAREFYAELMRHVESRFEVQDVIQAGERVVVSGRTRGMARRTGTAFDLRATHVYEMRQGKVIRMEAYIDTPRMVAVL
jgi:ketosteroid isomerase-like protein